MRTETNKVLSGEEDQPGGPPIRVQEADEEASSEAEEDTRSVWRTVHLNTSYRSVLGISFYVKGFIIHFV